MLFRRNRPNRAGNAKCWQAGIRIRNPEGKLTLISVRSQEIILIGFGDVEIIVVFCALAVIAQSAIQISASASAGR
jgi:hypothetical protein